MNQESPASAMTSKRHLVYGAAYVVCTFFSFPQLLPFAGSAIDVGWAIAPFTVVFLLASLNARSIAGSSMRQSFVWGFLVSLVAHYALFHWFYVVTVDYGHAPVVVGLLAPLLPSVFVSVFTALFCVGWQRLRRTGGATPVAAAFLWTAIDYIRGMALGGFPWGSLGYAGHDTFFLLPWVRFTGVYGLTFIFVLAGAGLAQLYETVRLGRQPGRSTFIAFGITLLTVFGGVLLGQLGAPVPSDTTVRIAALQGNIDQNEKWSPARVGANLGTYLQLSQRAIDAGADVVVWPESAVPGFIDLDPEIREPIRALVRGGNATFVLGAVAATLDLDTGEPEAFYDSAYLMDSEGTLTDRYDKTHLVPFGEFLPFRWLFGGIVEAVARGIATIDVSPGEFPRAMSIARIGAEEDVRVGVPICYELLFPDLVRRMSVDGARVLFAITNDAWYGRTGAPYQFLAMTAVRAAENGLPVVRAANSGVSAVIDSRGKVVHQSEIYVQDVVVGDISLSSADAPPTFYVKNGDVFAWLCWAFVLVIAFVPRFRAEPTRAA